MLSSNVLTYLLTGNRFLSNINWEIQVQHSYWCCWIDSNTEDSFFLFVLEHLHSQTICHSSLTVILPNCVILVTFSSPQIQKKSRPGKFSDACANHTLCDGKSHGTKVTALVVTPLFLGLFLYVCGCFLVGTVHKVRDALPNVKQTVTVGLLLHLKWNCV